MRIGPPIPGLTPEHISRKGIDIHRYDGKINWSEHISEIRRAYITPKTEKLEVLELLKSYVLSTPHDLKTPQGMMCMKRIIADFRSLPQPIGATGTPLPRPQGGPNWDPTNRLFADDLLFLCAEKMLDEQYRNTDMLTLLHIQFTEMSTGMCSQGRVTRMWQLYSSFPNPEDDKGVPDEETSKENCSLEMKN